MDGRELFLTLGMSQVTYSPPEQPFGTSSMREYGSCGCGNLAVQGAYAWYRGYLEIALASAFPEPALRLSPAGRIAWLDGYLDQLLTRDASDIAERDPAKIRRYFEGVASNTAGTPRDRKLYEAAAINARTAGGYDRLLRNLFVLDFIPAWTPNRLKRLTKSPKRYVVDAALAASALRLDAAGVMRDGDIMGRFLDTFVATQLRAEVAASRGRPRLYHLRAEGGRHEIDLLVEYADGRVLAMEVKADAAPDSAAARHLAWLRDLLGDRFLGGVVWHTGPRSFQLGERIMAHPISALWGADPERSTTGWRSGVSRRCCSSS